MVSTNSHRPIRALARLPCGAHVDTIQLKEAGVSSALASHYVRAGWLERLGRGVFQFPKDELTVGPNPNGIRALSLLLSNQPIGSRPQELAADLLAKSPMREAAPALLYWARESEDATPSLENYVSQTKSPAVWQAALNSDDTFRSEDNREAIRKGLEKYHSGRKLGP